MSFLQPGESTLMTLQAAVGSCADLKERQREARKLAVLSAVNALANDVPIHEVMNAIRFPVESDSGGYGYLSFSAPQQREERFAQWLASEVHHVVVDLAGIDEDGER